MEACVSQVNDEKHCMNFPIHPPPPKTNKNRPNLFSRTHVTHCLSADCDKKASRLWNDSYLSTRIFRNSHIFNIICVQYHCWGLNHLSKYDYRFYKYIYVVNYGLILLKLIYVFYEPSSNLILVCTYLTSISFSVVDGFSVGQCVVSTSNSSSRCTFNQSIVNFYAETSHSWSPGTNLVTGRGLDSWKH